MNPLTAPSVFWREGMFLGPQHFQSFTRELQARIVRGDGAGSPGEFGLLSLELDADALERDVLRVVMAELILRDGTFVSFPKNGHVEQREFGEHWGAEDLLVYLGVPAPKENVEQVGAEAGRRYRTEVDKIYDENLRDADREVEFKVLQGHLFFGTENRAGFETVPIARLTRQGHPEVVTVPSPTYVPPVLRVGASVALAERLREAAIRAREQARDLAMNLPDTTSLSSVESAADLSGLIKLQAVNRGVAVLEQLVGTPDLHPFHAYLELVRTIGDLSLFSSDRVPPALSPYDHDDLDGRFDAALDALADLLRAEVSVPYDRSDFIEDPEQEGIFSAKIPKDWLQGHPVFYLGVQVAREQDEVSELVAAGLKLLAPGDAEHVLQGVVPGVGLDPVRVPPLAFPNRSDLHFFRVETEGESRKLWLNVLKQREAMLLSALSALGDVKYGVYVELRP